MATKVIDALIVTLGLDASNYKKGSNEAVKQLGVTRTAVVKSSNEMGKAINGAARSFALAFLGFNTASGLVRMLTGLNEASRQLGIIGRNTDQTAQNLRNWGNAFAVAGGSADSFLNTIQQIQQKQASIQMTGVSGWEGFLRLLEVGITETGDDGIIKARDKLKVLGDLANAFQRMAREKGQPFANSLGLQMGFDQETMTVLVQGQAAIETLVDKQKLLAQNTEQLARNAERLRAQWKELESRATNLAGVLLDKLQPRLQAVFASILEFGENHGAGVIQGIQDGFQGLNATLQLTSDLLSLISQAIPSLPEMPAWLKSLSSVWDKLSSRYQKGVGLIHDAATGGARVKNYDEFMGQIGGTWQSNKAKYIDAIRAAEERHGIPAQLLEGVVNQESHWRSDIISGQRKSSAGATGIMQLMPQFFPGAGKDPNRDIETGAQYLKSLRDQFGSWEDAAAAYNAGPGTLNGVKAGRGGLPTETSDYVNALFGAGAAQRVAAPVGTGTVLAPSTGSSQSTTVGTINIFPASGTGEGVRLETARAIERKGLVRQADYGVRP